MTTRYALDAAGGLPEVIAAVTNGVSTQYLQTMGEFLTQYDANGWSYPLPDGLGSARQIANAQGRLFREQRYDPYGNVLVSQGFGGTIFGYTGEQVDPTGLVFLRARYYNPAIGVFLSKDPWPGNRRLSQTLNGWSYVMGNPVNLIDPSGYAPPTPLPSYCYGPQGPNDTRWKDDPICRQGTPIPLTPTPFPTPILTPSPVPPGIPCPVKRPSNCSKQWSGILPEGFRVDASATVILGLDVNLDIVTADYNPNQTSILINIALQGGISGGGGLSGGLLWHNNTCIEDYKTIDWSGGGTLFWGYGGEGNYGWSSTTNSQNVYLGAGGGAEFSLAGTKNIITIDVLNGEVTTIFD